MYPTFLIIAALEMGVELWISLRNSHFLRKQGARDIAPWILPFMSLIYVMFFIGSYLENLYREPALQMWWVALFLGLYVAAKILKFWAISALGKFWTMRVLVIPGAPVVDSGPYRWMKHPNYVSVMMELSAIPLLGKCTFTFAASFVLFSILLYFRIQEEERALKEMTDYSDRMEQKNRFLPF